MTTHSPVVLRELSGNQLFLVRRAADKHEALLFGTTDDIQSTMRLYPDAFLAASVCVCEGASEVGLVRGLDQYRTGNGELSIGACGVALIDCGGGGPDRCLARANAFRALGYRAAILRDDDQQPVAALEAAFEGNGGKSFSWRNGRTLEDELFASLTEDGVSRLIDRAVELHGEELINEHIRSASEGETDLATVRNEIGAARALLGKAARTRKAGWFKSVTWMEEAAREIVGPDLQTPTQHSKRSSMTFSIGRTMPDDNIDLLAIRRGAVTAPAGCGKTHLIAEALTRHDGTKPILILTHTNAGVVALRGRLDRAGAPPSAYRLMTIDGWAMRLFSMFPGRTGRDPELLKLGNPAADYPSIRVAAVTLLKGDHIGDILEASYARLIVDEYQDCSIRQHALVGYASKTLPMCVLGDPMQAIFGFGGDDLAEWEKQVCGIFPIVGELATPWRWINADAEALGRWLLDVRGKLLRGEPVDLRDAPDHVRWVELDGTNDYGRQLAAGRVVPSGGGGVLIIGDSRDRNSRHHFAGQTPGAVIVEAVDLSDFVTFARRFDLAAVDALERIFAFAGTIMTNVGGADTARRIRALRREDAGGELSDLDRVALRFQLNLPIGTPLICSSKLPNRVAFALIAPPSTEHASKLSSCVKVTTE